MEAIEACTDSDSQLSQEETEESIIREQIKKNEQGEVKYKVKECRSSHTWYMQEWLSDGTCECCNRDEVHANLVTCMLVEQKRVDAYCSFMCDECVKERKTTNNRRGGCSLCNEINQSC